MPEEVTQMPPATCCVCRKALRRDESRVTVHWRGGHYVVCCPACAREFRKAPGEHARAD